MSIKKILFLCQDLILANHLILILSELGHFEFNIAYDELEKNDMLKFGGYDLIFLHNDPFNKIDFNAAFENIKNKKLIILGTNEFKTNNPNKTQNEIINVKLPFSHYDIKKAFLNSKNLY